MHGPTRIVCADLTPFSLQPLRGVDGRPSVPLTGEANCKISEVGGRDISDSHFSKDSYF
jgi:hypothetical protein